MTTPELRPYQTDVVHRVCTEVAAGHRGVLIVAPTGSGKTVIAATLVGKHLGRGARVLFLAHRRELIRQASAKLLEFGICAGIMQAGLPAHLHRPVQVASVQTLHARAVRSNSVELPPADLVIIDEAHHVRARTYREIVERYPDAVILGLTATPCRTDGRGLGNVFEVIVESCSVARLVEDGHLVRAHYYAPSSPDLKGVPVRRGDYVERQLAERVDKPKLVGDIVEHWLRLANRRRTVVFATGVAHSLHLRDEFRRAGVLAEHIDGNTPPEERDRTLRQLASGEIEVVCNAMVLTEGWDCPEASCLILARPTKSLGLYLQMVGRVLRPAEHVGKTDALILDHAGAVHMHGFVDDEIVWTLHEDQRAENRSQSMRARGERPGLTKCPECTAIRVQGKPCTSCGWQPRRKGEAVDVVDGELGEVGRDRTVKHVDLDRHGFYCELLWIERERGYRHGWAAHKFREKFGVWPRWPNATPAPPTDATRAWVRSRMIAYARAQQKAQQAPGGP